MEKLIFEAGEGGPAEFYILEETKLGGVSYLLVTEEEEGDGEAFILKDVSTPEDCPALTAILLSRQAPASFLVFPFL